MMADEEYTDEMTQEDLDNLINRARTAESQNVKMSNALSTMFGDKKDQNFLHHQISTNELLEKLEHFYRGDKKIEDEDGNVSWEEQENKKLVTFNEFGVAAIMGIVTKYIDRNTILSSYNEDRIYEIIADIGDELILFILSNYEQLGMNTYFKKTQFRIIITTTCHMIESAYRRALKGHTLEELNQSKIVGQFGEQTPTPHAQQQRPNGFKRMIGFG